MREADEASAARSTGRAGSSRGGRAPRGGPGGLGIGPDGVSAPPASESPRIEPQAGGPGRDPALVGSLLQRPRRASPFAFSRAASSGVEDVPQPATPADMVRTLLLNVPAWGIRVGAARVETLHEIGAPPEPAEGQAASDVLPEGREVGKDPELAPAALPARAARSSPRRRREPPRGGRRLAQGAEELRIALDAALPSPSSARRGWPRARCRAARSPRGPPPCRCRGRTRTGTVRSPDRSLPP